MFRYLSNISATKVSPPKTQVQSSNKVGKFVKGIIAGTLGTIVTNQGLARADFRIAGEPQSLNGCTATKVIANSSQPALDPLNGNKPITLPPGTTGWATASHCFNQSINGLDTPVLILEENRMPVIPILPAPTPPAGGRATAHLLSGPQLFQYVTTNGYYAHYSPLNERTIEGDSGAVFTNSDGSVIGVVTGESEPVEGGTVITGGPQQTQFQPQRPLQAPEAPRGIPPQPRGNVRPTTVTLLGDGGTVSIQNANGSRQTVSINPVRYLQDLCTNIGTSFEIVDLIGQVHLVDCTDPNSPTTRQIR